MDDVGKRVGRPLDTDKALALAGPRTLGRQAAVGTARAAAFRIGKQVDAVKAWPQLSPGFVAESHGRRQAYAL
jgi:hypothetical protein